MSDLFTLTEILTKNTAKLQYILIYLKKKIRYFQIPLLPKKENKWPSVSAMF